ncbi:unnamed protein product [Symbiodinium pilosum]|uniref:Uncharacterized protein n=1 Tax=Symbiodinium pilosum TaxID=2952 RepID=A0A812YNT6_SYMPI|nr:unnamed protein product [Symbiodinium pilosum]
MVAIYRNGMQVHLASIATNKMATELTQFLDTNLPAPDAAGSEDVQDRFHLKPRDRALPKPWLLGMLQACTQSWYDVLLTIVVLLVSLWFLCATPSDDSAGAASSRIAGRSSFAFSSCDLPAVVEI